jgi:hypothetical protein
MVRTPNRTEKETDTMRQTILAAALVAFTLGTAAGQEAPAPTAAPAATAPKITFTDVMRTCGAEWRESAERKATQSAREDGRRPDGLAAWNAYRAECLVRKGWAKKEAKPKADFVRVPDKT